MYYMAENLEARHSEMAQRISDMTGQPVEATKREVDVAIQRLFYWAAYADKYGGTVQVSPSTRLRLRKHSQILIVDWA